MMKQEQAPAWAVRWNGALLIVAFATALVLLYVFTLPRTTPDGTHLPGPLLSDLLTVSSWAWTLRYLLRPYLYYGHLHVVLCVAVIVASALCAGRRFSAMVSRIVLRQGDTLPTGGAERVVIDIVVGFWLLTLVLFVVFSLHWGRSVFYALLVVTVIGPLVLWERLLWEVGVELRDWYRQWSREWRWGRVTLGEQALLAISAATLAAGGIMALAPPHQTDAMRYHLAVPDVWVREGGFVYLPHVAFSNFPFLVEMLYALPLALPDSMLFDPAAGLLHWVWLVLTCLAVHSAAHRVAGRLAGRMSVALVATTPFVPVLASWPFVEVALACAVVLTLLAVQRVVDAVETRERRWWLLYTGLFGGIALSIKYTALVLVIWCAAWLMVADTRRGIQRRARAAVWVALIALIAASPWFLKSLYYTGNPVYPLADTWFDGPDWSVRETSQYLGHARLKGDLWRVPLLSGTERVIDLFTLPYRLTVDWENFGKWPVGPAWLALVPLALVLRTCLPGRPRVHTFVISAGVLFLVWAWTYRDNRFLLPALAALSVPLGIALARCAAYHQPFPVLVGILSGVLLYSQFQSVASSFLGGHNVLPVVSGAISRDHFLSNPQIADYYPTFQKLTSLRNEIEGRVLIVGQELSYYCHVPYVCSDFFNTPVLVSICKQSSSVNEVRDRLRERNISHLFVNHARLREPGYRRLYDLHFLPDDQPMSSVTYAAYAGLRTPPAYQETCADLVRAIQDSPARALHDQFLDNLDFLRPLTPRGPFMVYALE